MKILLAAALVTSTFLACGPPRDYACPGGGRPQFEWQPCSAADAGPILIGMPEPIGPAEDELELVDAGVRELHQL